MTDEQDARFNAITVEIARMAVQPGNVVIVRIPEKHFSSSVAAGLHSWMRRDLPDNRVWVLPDTVDVTVMDSGDAERLEIPCTCSTYPAPHAMGCAITMALPRPLECACGDKSGVPHRHPQWANPAPRILTAHTARDNRRSEIPGDA